METNCPRHRRAVRACKQQQKILDSPILCRQFDRGGFAWLPGGSRHTALRPHCSFPESCHHLLQKRVAILAVHNCMELSFQLHVELKTQFHAVVNGENGDTFLQQVVATLWKTTVWSQGGVAGTSGQPGKTTSVELAAKDGRIQDLLLLFARSDRAPMSGTVSFHAKVSIPPGKRAFLEKVELQGDFGIDAGSF